MWRNFKMRKLILKWLGLQNVLTLSHTDYIDDCIESLLARKYDLKGMESKFDDYIGTVDDLEYKSNDWDSAYDRIEDLDVDDIVAGIEAKLNLDKVQQLDDRLTELVAGYKLDVQLVREEF